MKSDLGVLGLIAIAMKALLLLTSLEKMVKRRETTLAVGNLLEFLELELCFFHDWTRAMVTDTPKRLEHYIEESLMVHWPGEIDVTKVTWSSV
jgi:hypothetical protein